MADDNSAASPNKKKGRAAFNPHDDQRRTVADLASRRIEQVDIAAALGISVPTLRKYFATELATRLEPANLFAAASQSPAAQPAADPLPIQPAPRKPRPPRADGRKRWRPTAAQREDAVLMIAANFRPEIIAKRLDVTVPTFRRVFRADLDTANEMKRAELVIAMQRTAKGGNITAQRHLYELLERAELERLDAEVKGAPAAEKPSKALGKKEQAAIDANEVMADPEWRDLLQPAPSQPLN